MEDEVLEKEQETATEESTNVETTGGEEESEEATDGTDGGEQLDEDLDLDDLEYDEDGNIIIPDGIDKESTSTDADDESGADTASNATSDERDDEINRLREELAELKSQGKDTLKKLGINTEDVMEGLAELAAESSDLSTEEYKAERAKARADEREAEAKRIADFETLAAKDLAELQEYYPETKAYKHVKDMPEDVLKKFAANRNLGLPAKEAYAAANVEGIRNSAAQAAKRKAMNDNKAHLQSSHPKGGAKNGTYIPKKDMDMWRGMFPEKSDREIVALYKKTL